LVPGLTTVAPGAHRGVDEGVDVGRLGQDERHGEPVEPRRRLVRRSHCDPVSQAQRGDEALGRRRVSGLHDDVLDCDHQGHVIAAVRPGS
jgi:hypothetical protein